jgi:hypothetical protein
LNSHFLFSRAGFQIVEDADLDLRTPGRDLNPPESYCVKREEEEVIMIQFGDLRVGQPISHGLLTVFPLFCEVNRQVDYVLSDEAMEAGTVTVGEVSQEGSVPNLFVENKGDQRALFLEGEELRGAKQNRILNTSVLVPAHGKLPPPPPSTAAINSTLAAANASATRNTAPGTARSRPAPSSAAIPFARTRGLTSQRSHILLAGCRGSSVSPDADRVSRAKPSFTKTLSGLIFAPSSRRSERVLVVFRPFKL